MIYNGYPNSIPTYRGGDPRYKIPKYLPGEPAPWTPPPKTPIAADAPPDIYNRFANKSGFPTMMYAPPGAPSLSQSMQRPANGGGVYVGKGYLPLAEPDMEILARPAYESMWRQRAGMFSPGDEARRAAAFARAQADYEAAYSDRTASGATPNRSGSAPGGMDTADMDNIARELARTIYQIQARYTTLNRYGSPDMYAEIQEAERQAALARANKPYRNPYSFTGR